MVAILLTLSLFFGQYVGPGVWHYIALSLLEQHLFDQNCTYWHMDIYGFSIASVSILRIQVLSY